MKISVNTKYCNSVGELISEFFLPNLGGTCRVINNIFDSYELSVILLRYVTATLLKYWRILAIWF
jgi:hypothetical protein